MRRIFTLMSGLMFLLLILYTVLHTWEYDEAWTYLLAKDESIPDLLLYRHFNIANNHLLNSIWFKFIHSLGLRQVLFYRMATLLCFPVYCFFLFKTMTYKAASWTKKNDWWLLLFFLPPVMVYFSLGRGYGMATTLFIGALYYLKVYLEERKIADYWKFYFLGAISCLAIVSFLFPFVAMLIYIQLKSGDKIFSKKNVITALLFAPLALYIYHIGKTILLNDKIINGTDNLIVNGMYSTFISALGINELVFPFPSLLARLDLVNISKGIILLSFIPVGWIFIRKYRTRYAELIILLIMTLLFAGAHLLLRAKYPSDRSVIYVFYLIYIPVIGHIALKKDRFFKLNYFVVLFFSLINAFGFFYELTRPALYRTLDQLPEKHYTVVSDWPNWADDVYNDLYFDQRFTFQYVAQSFEKDWAAADKRLQARLLDPGSDFFLIQKATFRRNEKLFASGYDIQLVVSSGSKPLYLIHKK